MATGKNSFFCFNGFFAGEEDLSVPSEDEAPPERRLLAAMVSRAYEDVMAANKFVSQEDFKCSRSWISSNSRDPFSFLWTCEQLDMRKGVVDELRKHASGATWEKALANAKGKPNRAKYRFRVRKANASKGDKGSEGL